MNWNCLGPLLLCTIFLGGCNLHEARQKRRAAAKAASEAKGANETKKGSKQPEGEKQTAEASYLEQLNELYERAKKSGATTASNVAEWVGERVGDARQAGGDAATASSKWIQETYEAAKKRGETTAASARDWLMEDYGNMGAWEYKTIEFSGSDAAQIEAELNALGKLRWECFFVNQTGPKTTFYLKKRKRSYLRNIPARDLLRLAPLIGTFGGGGPEN